MVRCDNMAVVQISNLQKCQDPTLLHLMRSLHFYTALLDIRLRQITYRGGVQNCVADAISRNHLQVMRNLSPGADKEPTKVPSCLWQLLVTQRPDWRSPTWRHRLKTRLEVPYLEALAQDQTGGPLPGGTSSRPDWRSPTWRH